MPSVLAFGEALIDFVPTVSGVTLAEAPAFIRAPGGAPANVAVGLSRLGVSSGFMGMLGDDAFGHYLAGVLAENGVDTRGLRFTDRAGTPLAFVSLRPDGEREFIFYRHPGADMLFGSEDVDASLVQEAHVFHFGSLGLGAEASRAATFRAVEIARAAGRLVSFDPNLRLNLWPDPGSARAAIREAWPLADVVKLTEAEFEFIDPPTVPRLMVVTMASQGCRYVTPGAQGQVPGFSVAAVDTTGAGDAFMAGLLARLLERPEAMDEESHVREACRFANAAGALAVTALGAIPALPTHLAVQTLLRETRQGG